MDRMTAFEDFSLVRSPEVRDGARDVVDRPFDPAFRQAALNCPEVDRHGCLIDKDQRSAAKTEGKEF